MTKVIQVDKDKRAYIELLLLGDEQENMIERYLERGQMLALVSESETIAVCVFTDKGNGICEIKNIAVMPDKQRQGYGKALLSAVESECRGKFRKIVLGTGNSPLTIPFYESCGFRHTGIIRDWFTENYDHPIIECGIQLCDMILFEKDLED